MSKKLVNSSRRNTRENTKPVNCINYVEKHCEEYPDGKCLYSYNANEFLWRGNIVHWLQNRQEKIQQNQLYYEGDDELYEFPYKSSRGEVEYIPYSFFLWIRQKEYKYVGVCNRLKSFFKK